MLSMSITIYNTNYLNLPLVSSINACLLMSKLEEYFKEYPEGFIKPLIRSQDATPLAKTLGMREWQFESAFKSICKNYYNTKKPLTLENRFDGKYYLVRRLSNTLENKVVFERNDELLDGLFKEYKINLDV